MDRLIELSEAAGVMPRWRDVHDTWHDVAPDTLRAILAALDLPAATPAQISASLAELAARNRSLPPLLTATCDECTAVPCSGRFHLVTDDGGELDGVVEDGVLPPISRPGYHTLTIAGSTITLAVAPARAVQVRDVVPNRPWALAVQLYALRRADSGGIGDFRALEEMVTAAGQLGAAGIAISPVHAQFSADIHRFSPYSPSSRTQLNVLHAGLDVPDNTTGDLIDWPAAARERITALRAACAAASPPLLAELAQFRVAGGSALQTHATFEALHAAQFGADPSLWHWRTWPATLRNPDSPDVHAFAEQNADEVSFHAFAQFMADRSLASAQRAARDAGMPIGLIADLAVGADSGGSQCWSRQDEMLLGMTIGAPPDLLSRDGQSWGLAAFSPRGLRDKGYRAMLEMLRCAMRHAGGVRIDHALGLRRLWVVPDGASARDGAYLVQPMQDLLRLIALESHRNRAIVLGEDLGTIPDGFQDRMREVGMLGMRVLWFEKKYNLFTDPGTWTPEAVAMTSTHDLPTVAGWWIGRDIGWRRTLDLAADIGAEEAERRTDRAALWAAFQHSGAAQGDPPTEPAPVIDAAVRHLATAACDMVILPIEDALGLVEQPNLPGTLDEKHPNWRRRLSAPSAELLGTQEVRSRLAPLRDKA